MLARPPEACLLSRRIIMRAHTRPDTVPALEAAAHAAVMDLQQRACTWVTGSRLAAAVCRY